MANTYSLTREELKKKKATDFNDGDVIKCGRYTINISYTDPHGIHNYPMPVSFYTTVNKGSSKKPLLSCDVPKYIRQFINCYNSEI